MTPVVPRPTPTSTFWHHPVSQLPSHSEDPRNCILTNSDLQNYCSTLLIRSFSGNPSEKNRNTDPIGHRLVHRRFLTPSSISHPRKWSAQAIRISASQAQAPLVPPAVLLSISSSNSQPKKVSVSHNTWHSHAVYCHIPGTALTASLSRVMRHPTFVAICRPSLFLHLWLREVLKSELKSPADSAFRVA